MASMRLWMLGLVAVLGLIPGPVAAQTGFNPDAETKTATDINPNDVIHWTGVRAESFSDRTVEVTVTLATEQEFGLYPDKVIFTTPGYNLKGFSGPTVKTIKDPMTGNEVG